MPTIQILNLEDLPLDAFELSGEFEVEHLTAGHGLTESGAFCSTCCCVTFPPGTFCCCCG